MITYELAKELKDKGFPQSTYSGFNDGQRLTHYYTAYIPTLSELLEACGDDFDYINRVKEGYLAGKVTRRGLDAADTSAIFEFGETPEEAVARFWLTLNKK